MKIKTDAIECAKKIQLIIFDVDGVLTDGSINISSNGELFKSFNCRDGLGITIAHRVGLKLAIITGRKSEIVEIRARETGIDKAWQGNLNKRDAFEDAKKFFNVTEDQICYVGDDLIDLPIMTRIGLPAAVNDAVEDVRNIAKIVSEFDGGHGAAREIIEFILKSQNRWQNIVDEYSR